MTAFVRWAPDVYSFGEGSRRQILC